MQWRFWRRDDSGPTDVCDPAAAFWALALLHHYLGAAEHSLRSTPGIYGQCHVVPTLRGWDPIRERWRQPMAFDGPTCDEARSTCSVRSKTLPTMAALPEVIAVDLAHA